MNQRGNAEPPKNKTDPRDTKGLKEPKDAAFEENTRDELDGDVLEAGGLHVQEEKELNISPGFPADQEKNEFITLPGFQPSQEENAFHTLPGFRPSQEENVPLIVPSFAAETEVCEHLPLPLFAPKLQVNPDILAPVSPAVKEANAATLLPDIPAELEANAVTHLPVIPAELEVSATPFVPGYPATAEVCEGIPEVCERIPLPSIPTVPGFPATLGQNEALTDEARAGNNGGGGGGEASPTTSEILTIKVVLPTGRAMITGIAPDVPETINDLKARISESLRLRAMTSGEPTLEPEDFYLKLGPRPLRGQDEVGGLNLETGAVLEACGGLRGGGTVPVFTAASFASGRETDLANEFNAIFQNLDDVLTRVETTLDVVGRDTNARVDQVNEHIALLHTRVDAATVDTDLFATAADAAITPF